VARGGDRDRDRDRRRSPKDTGKRTKKKVCIFCKDHIQWVDYKDVNLLRRFMSDRGKIRAQRVSGNCRQHQRDVSIAIKTARELALLPYTQRAASERGGGRGGRGGRDMFSGPPRAEAEAPPTPSTPPPGGAATASGELPSEAPGGGDDIPDIPAMEDGGGPDGGAAVEPDVVESGA
jgi:small subunit ribosomal protein S18